MSGTFTKRQQARNEKALQDLVHNVPGNDICADCHARNPAWASWSLGVFLCMRCASIHRKLGTHVSKVKSLSMDSWANEQVDNMRKVGNVVSNQIYNPENKKPPVPVDADEADSAMERFIRQKYMNNVAKSGGLRSPRSDEGTPPPLPPKNSTSSKFGFRSATSSLFPTSKAKKDRAAMIARQPTSPPAGNKPSKVFGAAVGYDTPDDSDAKLARLRDMGFGDTQRNAVVLRGVHGDLERAVEALVRLGEGERRSPAAVDEAPKPALRTSRSLQPVSSTPAAGLSLGLTVGSKAGSDRPFTPSSAVTSASSNPFDGFSTAQPQTAHSTGSLQTNNPYGQATSPSTNPFGPVRTQTDPLSQAFQGLNVSAPPQQLFPNHTGGVAAQQPSNPWQQQPAVPSLPASPASYQGPTFASMHSMTYPQPAQPPLPSQATGYNPFLSNPTPSPSQPYQAQPHAQPQTLMLNTQQAQQPTASNPFARSPTRVVSPSMLGQIPEQTQSTFQSMSPQQQQQQQPVANNPFLSNAPMQSPAQMTQQQQYFAPQQQQQQTQQPQQQQQQRYQQPLPQQPQRQDNASIMALFGSMPTSPQTQQQPVPTSPSYAVYGQQPQQPQQSQPPAQQPTNPYAATQPQQQQPPPVPDLHRAQTAPVVMPPSMSPTNPFMSNAGVSQAGAADLFGSVPSGGRQATRESILLGNDMAWTNGRHSPDAFASLSASHR